MTDYPELGSIRIDTGFTRPYSDSCDFLTEPIPYHNNQTQLWVRDVTWISTPQSQTPSAHTPQTPRSSPTITESELDAEYMAVSVDDCDERQYQEYGSSPMITESDSSTEYMTVSVDDCDESEYQGRGYGSSEVIPVAMDGKNEKRINFIRGFVNGLRRVLKVMSKSRLRDRGKLERQGTGGTAASTTETGL